jgi:hypothetical protein
MVAGVALRRRKLSGTLPLLNNKQRRALIAGDANSRGRGGSAWLPPTLIFNFRQELKKLREDPTRGIHNRHRARAAKAAGIWRERQQNSITKPTGSGGENRTRN